MPTLAELITFLQTSSPVDESHNPAGTLHYDATSPAWKTFCDTLPCTAWMGWNGYATAAIEVEIEGKPAVIQCWKGTCQQFPPRFSNVNGPVSFPGGVGAEVGIYRKDPNRPFITLKDLVSRRLGGAVGGMSEGILPVRGRRPGRVPGDGSLADGVSAADADLEVLNLDALNLEGLSAATPDAEALPDISHMTKDQMVAATSEWLGQRYTPDVSPVGVRLDDPAAPDERRDIARPGRGAIPPELAGADQVDLFRFPDLDPRPWLDIKPWVDKKFRWNEQWFPATDLTTLKEHPVSFTLRDPKFGNQLMTKYSTDTYWTCKWMRESDYRSTWYPAWHARHGSGAPVQEPIFHPYELKLEFTVAGVDYIWDTGSEIRERKRR